MSVRVCTVWTVVLALGAAASATPIEPARPAQVTEVAFDTDRWVGDWVKMWNSYDLDLVDEFFVSDDRLTYLSSEREGVIVGIEAVREHHRGFGFVPGGEPKEAKLWVEDLHTTVLGSSVVVAGVWFLRKANGPIQRGPMTMVYIGDGETFRLAHLHFANYPAEAQEEAER